MKPAARAGKRAQEIVEDLMPNLGGVAYAVLVGKITSELLAAERAAAERMRERCAQEGARAIGVYSGNGPCALFAMDAIRALPLEEPDV